MPNMIVRSEPGILVSIVSWNHGGCNFTCDSAFDIACTPKPHLLLVASAECGGVLPDITANSDAFTNWWQYLTKRLDKVFVHVATRRRQGLVISVWLAIASGKIEKCSLIDSTHSDLSWDRSGRKGCLQVTIEYRGSIITFVAVHFDAFKFETRVRQLRKVIHKSMNSTVKPQIVFIVGDMNFRVDLKDHDVLLATRLGAVHSLVGGDQLTKLLLSKYDWLDQWKEATRPSFLPTYKMRKDDSGYDYQSQRLPAYTDRILVWSEAGSVLRTLEYSKDYNTHGSDHCPIFGRFVIQCR